MNVRFKKKFLILGLNDDVGTQLTCIDSLPNDIITGGLFNFVTPSSFGNFKIIY